MSVKPLIVLFALVASACGSISAYAPSADQRSAIYDAAIRVIRAYQAQGVEVVDLTPVQRAYVDAACQSLPALAPLALAIGYDAAADISGVCAIVQQVDNIDESGDDSEDEEGAE